MAYTQASDYLEQQFCAFLLGDMDTAPTDLEVRLYFGNPTDTGSGGTDVTTDIRAAGAVAVTFGTPTLVGSNYEIANSGTVDFGNNEDAGSITVDHVAIWIGGFTELICYAELSSPAVFAPSDPVSFGAGEIKIRMEQYWGATAQQALLNWIRGTDPTEPSLLYAALYTAAPGFDNSGSASEVTNSITGSDRPSVTWNGEEEDAGTDTYFISNDGKLDFGASANTIGSDITHVALFDATSSGNLIFWGSLGESLPINAGNNVFFEDQQLVLRVA
jgi:hypothetical protein